MNRWLLSSLLVFTVISSGAAVQQAITIAPVADVWKSPAASEAGLTDDLRQTQLVAGETVSVFESSGDWVRIEIPDQPAFRPNNRWQGYPGWVRGSALALLSAPKGTRAAILDVARAYVGSPYLWGGVTPAGADCSGLVHLAYRFNGIQIPRDSYEQWMKAKPIARRELKPADLILSAKTSDPKKISHVALYAGADRILEAPQNGIAVREISFRDKYGADLSQVESGQTVGEHVIFFGRVLKR